MQKSTKIQEKDSQFETYNVYFPAQLLFSPTFGQSIEGQLTEEFVLTAKGVAILAKQRDHPDREMFCRSQEHWINTFSFLPEQNKDELALDVFKYYRRWILRDRVIRGEV